MKFHRIRLAMTNSTGTNSTVKGQNDGSGPLTIGARSGSAVGMIIFPFDGSLSFYSGVALVPTAICDFSVSYPPTGPGACVSGMVAVVENGVGNPGSALVYGREPGFTFNGPATFIEGKGATFTVTFNSPIGQIPHVTGSASGTGFGKNNPTDVLSVWGLDAD